MQNTTYKRTPLTKCPLIFLRQNAKKKKFSEKLIRKKIQKSFIVNNNNKIIRAWYLSSKWLVCRSIVNQTTGGVALLPSSCIVLLPVLKLVHIWALLVSAIFFILSICLEENSKYIIIINISNTNNNNKWILNNNNNNKY